LLHIAHETAGAARIRHSLRPLFREVAKITCKPRALCVARMRAHTQMSSPGSTGRPSIPETLMMEPIGPGVLDPPHARGMTVVCGAASSTVIACDKREAFAQGSSCDEAIHSFLVGPDGLLRCARNDGGHRPARPGL